MPHKIETRLDAATVARAKYVADSSGLPLNYVMENMARFQVGLPPRDISEWAQAQASTKDQL